MLSSRCCAVTMTSSRPPEDGSGVSGGAAYTAAPARRPRIAITADETLWLAFTIHPRSWIFSLAPPEEILLEGKTRNELRPRRGNQHFFLELHALGSPYFTDVALDTHHHAGLEQPGAAESCEILRVRDERCLAVHPD